MMMTTVAITTTTTAIATTATVQFSSVPSCAKRPIEEGEV